jgi:hypothetical protein
VDIPQGTNFCRSESEDEVPRRNPTAMGSSSSPRPIYHNVAPRGSEMKRCAHCGGKFGLVRYKWYSRQFCRKRCREAYLDKLAADRDRLRRWLGFVARPG